MATHPIQKKNRYHHGDLADALIRATVQLLSEKGANAISLREVARIAGVSHGAPAHHFGDKAGLLTAVAVEGHLLLAKELDAQILHKRAPRSRLLAAGEGYVRFAVGHPGYFNVMFQSAQIHPTSPALVEARQKSRDVLRQSVINLDGGDVNNRKLNGIVTALWSQVHGFSILWLAGNFGDPDDTPLFEQLLPEMLNGITPRV